MKEWDIRMSTGVSSWHHHDTGHETREPASDTKHSLRDGSHGAPLLILFIFTAQFTAWSARLFIEVTQHFIQCSTISNCTNCLTWGCITAALKRDCRAAPEVTLYSITYVYPNALGFSAFPPECEEVSLATCFTDSCAQTRSRAVKTTCQTSPSFTSDTHNSTKANH